MSLRLPPALLRVIEALPVEPPSFVLARVLDRVLWPRLDEAVRARLRGHVVELKIDGLGVLARVKLGAVGFEVARGAEASAVRIAATPDTYWRLARGDDDADRLFFERALLMEGDTETALVIKNTLDAIGPLWSYPRAA